METSMFVVRMNRSIKIIRSFLCLGFSFIQNVNFNCNRIYFKNSYENRAISLGSPVKAFTFLDILPQLFFLT